MSRQDCADCAAVPADLYLLCPRHEDEALAPFIREMQANEARYQMHVEDGRARDRVGVEA